MGPKNDLFVLIQSKPAAISQATENSLLPITGNI